MKTLPMAGWLLAGVSLVLGCSEEPEPGSNKRSANSNSGAVAVKQATPEEAAASFQEGVEKKDWEKSFACLTDDSQNMMLASAHTPAKGAAIADPEKNQSLSALMQKHGAEGGVTKAKNKGALFGALLDWLKTNAVTTKSKYSPLRFMQDAAKFKITNFQKSGDTATADATLNGKRIRTIYFREKGGKWYLDLVRTLNPLSRIPLPPFPSKTKKPNP